MEIKTIHSSVRHIHTMSYLEIAKLIISSSSEFPYEVHLKISVNDQLNTRGVY